MKYSNRHISDEELDQLFRDAHASEGQESLFVPEFWSEMEAMLPTEKKSKRGFYWIPLAATLLLVSLLLFYPSNRAQIDKFQQQADVKNGSDENSFKADNSTIQTINNEISDQSRLKTTFRTSENGIIRRNPNKTNNVGLTDISPVPVAPMITGLNGLAPEERTEPLVDPKPKEESSDESDFTRLEPRQDRVIHDGISGLAKNLSNESNQWYLELGPTIGQSPYLSSDQKRNIVAGAVLGGGYTKRIDNAFVSFGLQARMEGFGGLNYRETNFSPNMVRTVSVKQLYSIDIPLKFGYSFKKSEISFGVTPGIQLFVHGKEQIMQNQVIQRQDSYTGKVEHSNSLSMEFGFQYYYNLSPKYSIGAKVNADVLRPFHTDYYLGKLASFPMNGQIVIRRTFSR
nr:outer membrane beta-barrel protein [uncultured Fluviicola sp.]